MADYISSTNPFEALPADWWAESSDYKWLWWDAIHKQTTHLWNLRQNRHYMWPYYPNSVEVNWSTSHTGTLSYERSTSVQHNSYGTSPMRMNYAEWVSAEGTLQDYTIEIQWRLPKTFVRWDGAGGGLAAMELIFKTDTADPADQKLRLYVYKNTSLIHNEDDLVAAPAGTWWGNTEFTDAELGGSWAADDLMTIAIRMYSKDSHWVRVGQLSFGWYCYTA